MFLFFPFILPLKSYLLSSSCSRIANVRVVEESTPQEKRKRGTAPFVFFFKHPFPFFYLSILNYNRFNDTKKKKKKSIETQSFLSRFFLSFLPSFFFFLHFITFLYIIQADLSFEKEIFFPSLWRRLNNRERGIERKGKGSRKTRSFCFRESFIPSIPLQTSRGGKSMEERRTTIPAGDLSHQSPFKRRMIQNATKIFLSLSLSLSDSQRGYPSSLEVLVVLVGK